MPDLILSENDNGKTLRVTPGTRIQIQLKENPTTGYRWSVRQSGNPSLTLESNDFSPGAGDGMGAGGTRQLTFVASQPGQATIELKNMREWEGESSARAQFTLSVVIQ